MATGAVIIGIDPGVKTGVAIFNAGKLLELKTIEPCDYSHFFQAAAPTLVVLEDSRLTSTVFTAPGSSDRARLKVARNIGMVDGCCHFINAVAEQKRLTMDS